MISAMVIGGGRGIGASIVEHLARSGRAVMVADTNTLSSAINHYRSRDIGGYTAAMDLCGKLAEAGHTVASMQADAADEVQVEALFAAAKVRFGPVQEVINAVGITDVGAIDLMPLESFEAIIRGNLTPAFLISRAAARTMMNSGGGRIIHISSVSGKVGFAKVSHYCAAKAGMIGLVKALSAELAKYHISVNAVCPGIVRTNMWEYLLAEFQRPGEDTEACWRRIQAMIPAGEAQEKDDISKAVSWLLDTPAVTGQAISVDGGMAQ